MDVAVDPDDARVLEGPRRRSSGACRGRGRSGSRPRPRRRCGRSGPRSGTRPSAHRDHHDVRHEGLALHRDRGAAPASASRLRRPRPRRRRRRGRCALPAALLEHARPAASRCPRRERPPQRPARAPRPGPQRPACSSLPPANRAASVAPTHAIIARLHEPARSLCCSPRRSTARRRSRHASRARRPRPAPLGLAAQPRPPPRTWPPSSARRGSRRCGSQAFESHGIQGANVIGVLRAPGAGVRGVGAHHDTAPDAPGAYDDGGGVGRADRGGARARADKQRPRTLVFVSFDGEEAWSTGKTTTAGLARLRRGARRRARASWWRRSSIEMCGWQGRHAGPPPDRLRGPAAAGRQRDRARLAGARGARGRARRGRALRRRRPVPLLALPARRAHLPRAALRRRPVVPAGRACRALRLRLVVLRLLSGTTSPPTPPTSSTPRPSRGWGRRARCRARPRAGAARARHEPQLVRRLRLRRRGAVAPGARRAEPACRGCWRGLAAGGPSSACGWSRRCSRPCCSGAHPVPALWVLLLPQLLLPLEAQRGGRRFSSLAPALGLAAIGLSAWYRGVVSGLWLAPWEIVVLFVALVLAFFGLGTRTGRKQRKPRKGR